MTKTAGEVRIPEFYRGAVFDLDGTLADSMGIWDHLCRDWLLSKQREAPPGLERILAPMTVTQAAEYAARNFDPGYEPAEIITQWENMVMDRYREKVPLKEGAAELLRELAERGFKLALATSCFPSAAEAFLDSRGIGHFFSAIMYTDEFRRDKSFPDIWLACAERLELPPARCLVFEDTYASLAGVRAAGMGFAAVYDDSCERWDDMQTEADLVLHTLGSALSGPRDSDP